MCFAVAANEEEGVEEIPDESQSGCPVVWVAVSQDLGLGL